MNDSAPTTLETCLELLAVIPDDALEPRYAASDTPNYAAEYTRIILRELLATGEPGSRDEEGYAALYHARHCPQLLQALLAAGCTPATCSDEELLCLLDEQLPLSAIRLMLEAGANPNVKDEGDSNATPPASRLPE